MNQLKSLSYKALVGLFIILLTTINPFRIAAQNDLPDPMKPYRMVNDFSGIFDAQQQASLEGKLRNYHNRTTVQIYVITVDSLNGDAPYNYAARIGEKWGIGQKGKDNGILILIKPKTKNQRGEVFIAPGYGLEAQLNDAYCGRIIDNEMIPSLKSNDYYTATDNAINAIIYRISGDKELAEYAQSVDPKYSDNESSTFSDIFWKFIVLPAFIISFILFPRFRTVVLYILLLFIRSGGSGDRRGGGGRSGGGSSFGGGGGGRFGGGGAGRSW